MERPPIKLAILTSTRADFGIYQPLLDELNNRQATFQTELIVFGTHLSRFHGYTLREIESHYDFPIHRIYGMPLSDEATAIAQAYGHLIANFAAFWAESDYDWVLALGDRYEMSAAVQAGIPLGIRFAHLHGGETTLGAIDNIYRHQISLASRLHLVATDAFAKRVRELTHSTKVYTVGALSLDQLASLKLPDWPDVKATFELPVDDFVLCTFHPETIAFRQNEEYSKVATEALGSLAEEIPIVITLPNADTNGTLFRAAFQALQQQYPERIFLVESFGKRNYFAAMQQARFLLGNTSSGIIEAASFGKYVVNVGQRQEGRPQSDNIWNVPFKTAAILEASQAAGKMGTFTGENIYRQANSAKKILDYLSDV